MLSPPYALNSSALMSSDSELLIVVTVCAPGAPGGKGGGGGTSGDVNAMAAFCDGMLTAEATTVVVSVDSALPKPAGADDHASSVPITDAVSALVVPMLTDTTVVPPLDCAVRLMALGDTPSEAAS